MMSVLGAVSGISSLINTVSDTANKVQGGKKELDQSDFLALLTKQLTTQSPLEPYDSSSMLQQMANLTSLNTSDSLKKSISGLTNSLGNAQLYQASQLVGRQVQVSSNKGPLTTDGLKGSVLLTERASDVSVSIKDSTGKVVKTLKLGDVPQGTLDFQWNGVADDGTKMPNGIYQISAVGTINGQSTAITTASNFKVSSISLNQQTQGLEFNVDGAGTVAFDKVLKII